MTEPQQAGNRSLIVSLGVGVGVLLLVVGVLAGVLIAKSGSDEKSETVTVASSQDTVEDYEPPTTDYEPPTTVYVPPTTPVTAASYTPPPTRATTARPSSGSSYQPCPTGEINANIDKAELVEHREGSEYWEYRFTMTVTNNKSASVDWYYVRLTVNGDPDGPLLKDETYNSAAVTLAPGQSYTWTHRPVLVSSPSGQPSFGIGKISWLWPNGANYPPDCRKNP